MIFSRLVLYSIKSLVYICKQDQGEFSGIKEISENSGISKTYLAKILQKLVTAEILMSVTGPGGGFKFRKDPANIKLIDIIRIFDEEKNLSICILGWSECGHNNPCHFHKNWAEFIGKFKKDLETRSIMKLAQKSWPRM